MDNGCPKCEKLMIYEMCLYCQRDHADADLLKAMNRVEEIKQKIKEKESVSTNTTNIR